MKPQDKVFDLFSRLGLGRVSHGRVQLAVDLSHTDPDKIEDLLDRLKAQTDWPATVTMALQTDNGVPAVVISAPSGMSSDYDFQLAAEILSRNARSLKECRYIAVAADSELNR